MERSIIDNKKADSLCLAGMDSTVSGEFGGELTMPDYYPEIRRIVRVTADALPDSKFLQGDSLEIGGTLAFCVLYIGDDGTLASVPYVTEYGQTVSAPEGCNVQSAWVDSRAEGASARPLAPRKMSLRAKVKSRVVCEQYRQSELSLKEGEDRLSGEKKRDGLEKLCSCVQTLRRRHMSVTGSVEGSLECGEEIMKAVMCRGELSPAGVKIANGELRAFGEVEVSVLVLTKAGEYKTLSKKLPFEERLTVEAGEKDCRGAVYGRVAALSAEADGEGRVLAIDGEYDLDIITERPVTVTVVEDIYSRTHAVALSREEMEVLSPAALENAALRIAGEGRRKSQRSEGESLIYYVGEAAIDRVYVSEGRLIATGTCSIKALIASLGEVLTEELSLPITFEKKLEGEADLNCRWQAAAAVSDCRVRVEEQKISAEASVSLFCSAVRETGLSPVTEISFGEELSKKGDGESIVICYPEKGRRVWDVAKEHLCDMGECERINKKSRADITNGEPIIIR